MELRSLFKNSSDTVYEENMDLLEDYDLISPLGSPNKVFLKFLKSKKLEIKKDELTPELIEEFEGSIDSINLRLAKIKKEKEIIFRQRKVWINIPTDGEPIESDLHLKPDSILIEETGQEIFYKDMLDIKIAEGGWSKKKITIETDDDDISFEVNETKAIPLKEILEDNIANKKHDEIDDLLELYSLFEEGKISEDELELRKAIIYSDERYCTECGEKLDPDSMFCANCGHEVTD